MNDSLKDIRNKLTELKDRSKKNNIRTDGIADESWETWEKCERKVQRLLSEKLDISDVVIERAHKVKAYSHETKNSKKLRSRTINCKLLSFVGKARILKNSHRLKGTRYSVNEDFSKKTLAYRKELWEKGKALRKKDKVTYLNYKSIVVKETNNPHV